MKKVLVKGTRTGILRNYPENIAAKLVRAGRFAYVAESPEPEPVPVIELPDEPEQEPEPEPEPIEPAPEEPEEEDPAEGEPPLTKSGKPDRRYKRKDLQAAEN